MGKLSEKKFFEKLNSNKSQTCLDIAVDLIDSGYSKEAMDLLSALPKYTDDIAPAIAYMIGDPTLMTDMHRTFPFRPLEAKVLAENGANCLLAYYHYGDRRYDEAEALFAKGDDYASKRGLALCAYRRGDVERTLQLLDEAHALCPDMEQIVFEIAYVLNHTGAEPNAAAEKIGSMIPSLANTRDDIATEWAAAYNRAHRYDEALAVLDGHSFVPCEGGETALARQYIAAWYGKGLDFRAAGRDDEALEAFRRAQTLPENLGAGLWHMATVVPAQYEEALLLEKQGDRAGAEKIYNYFGTLYVDFFSNMNLPLLPVYQALGDIRLGKADEAKALLEKTLADWKHEAERHDSGYFGTTPFFISYMDDPKTARKKHYDELIRTAEAVLDGTSELLK